MQADPVVQEAQNSQNLNRYTYVLNNPLGYTDPSGYMFSALWNKVKPLTYVIVGAGLLYLSGGSSITWQGAAMIGAASGAVGAAVNGGNIFKSAAIGAFSGAIFHGIGNSYTGAAGTAFAEGGLGHIAAHAMTGGIISVLSGGKFGHGFASAGFSNFAMSSAGFDYDDISSGAIASRTITAALIGGTSSVISGGKFANGATTAAMAHLFNQVVSNAKKQNNKIVIDSTMEALDHYINGKGESVELGDETQKAIKNSKDQQYRLDRIVTGKTKSLNGNYGVDIESEVYHVGDTRVDYLTKCDSNSCTTYFETGGDGFWDPIYDSDGIGPNGEFGNPFRYDPITWEVKYPKPNQNFGASQTIKL